MTSETTTLSHVEHAFAPIGEPLERRALKAIPGLFVDGTTSESVDILSYGKEFAEHYSKLNSIISDSSLWPEDAESPTVEAKNWTWLVVQQLVDDGLAPTKIVASAEGGIAVCFVSGNKYADIECLNSGEILGVLTNKHDRPTVWEIEQDPAEIARATGRIAKFIQG